ncbi:acyltransferase [Tabrizicola sp. J26]|uniref:acyltransferase family protein n=1 Tax=Alitabrizicola rongguiensis TaxID=2909234 RepID=UPI001F21A341|nr:acyltransferase [Tabrizicola rongguiensis]MCF1711073.1 acyltransferase [Tabrizicola rongguiensis]
MLAAVRNPKLAEVARGRDNNLNLIRALAATAVLVSHAYPLSLGPGAAEPLEGFFGKSLGSLAVDVFFVISGYLIAASFARSESLAQFVAARGLRLFPGLLVSLLLVALVMGPAVTSLPLAEYFRDREFLEFVPKNMLLVSPAYELPGVFETNPYPAVEGSIWTLFYEVACYGGIFLIGIAGAFRDRRRLFVFLAGFYLAWAAYHFAGLDLHPKLDSLHRLSLPFAIGTTFYAIRDRMPLSLPILAALALLTWLAHGTTAFPPVLALAIGYGTFWLAFIPRGAILGYNRIGDYSYGIYVYAFPLQGLVIWLWGPMGPGLNIALALPLTLICAVLSWHLIEAPALEMRRRFGAARARG